MDIEMINPWTQVKSYDGHFERSQTGMFFCVIGIDLKLKLNYMPMLLFFYGFVLITIIQLIETVRYRGIYI